MTIFLFFSLSPVANCPGECDGKSYKTLQAWINYLIQGFRCSWKWIGWGTGVGGFISPQDSNFRGCFILLCWDLFSKKEGQIHSNFDKQMCVHLARIQHKVFLLALRTVFAVGFWLPSFLQPKLWARIPLQIGDSPSVVFLYLCVNFHKCVTVAF